MCLAAIRNCESQNNCGTYMEREILRLCRQMKLCLQRNCKLCLRTIWSKCAQILNRSTRGLPLWAHVFATYFFNSINNLSRNSVMFLRGRLWFSSYEVCGFQFTFWSLPLASAIPWQDEHNRYLYVNRFKIAYHTYVILILSLFFFGLGCIYRFGRYSLVY